ncbi:hypothetical protein BB561_006346 [Smittium simulii]|uniref:Uncharacterized protein n=1 Tax=Smittium simulii TaxID=133385 RepID=A0A2T9Y4Z0_9FUNG|nr:hypothetical protein BB561_006346 [Smittium simulii]
MNRDSLNLNELHYLLQANAESTKRSLAKSRKETEFYNSGARNLVNNISEAESHLYYIPLPQPKNRKSDILPTNINGKLIKNSHKTNSVIKAKKNTPEAKIESKKMSRANSKHKKNGFFCFSENSSTINTLGENSYNRRNTIEEQKGSKVNPIYLISDQNKTDFNQGVEKQAIYNNDGDIKTRKNFFHGKNNNISEELRSQKNDKNKIKSKDRILNFQNVLKKGLSAIVNVGRKCNNIKSANNKKASNPSFNNEKKLDNSRLQHYSKLLKSSNKLFKPYSSELSDYDTTSDQSLKSSKLKKKTPKKNLSTEIETIDMSIISIGSKVGFSWYDNSKYGNMPKKMRKSVYYITDIDSNSNRDAPSDLMKEIINIYETLSGCPFKIENRTGDKNIMKNKIDYPKKRSQNPNFLIEVQETKPSDFKAKAKKQEVRDYEKYNKVPFKANKGVNSSVLVNISQIPNISNQLLSLNKNKNKPSPHNQEIGNENNRTLALKRGRPYTFTRSSFIKYQKIYIDLSKIRSEKKIKSRTSRKKAYKKGRLTRNDHQYECNSIDLTQNFKDFWLSQRKIIVDNKSGIAKNMPYTQNMVDLSSPDFFKIVGARAVRKSTYVSSVIEPFENAVTRPISLVEKASNSKDFVLEFKLERRKLDLRNTLQIGEKISYKKYLNISADNPKFDNFKTDIWTTFNYNNRDNTYSKSRKLSDCTVVESQKYKPVTLKHYSSCVFSCNSAESLIS